MMLSVRSIRILAALAATLPAASAVAQSASAITAFVDVSIVPMDSDRVLSHQTVVVRGGHITALGPLRRTAIPAGAMRIDGRGKFVMPGLGNMHAHLENFETRDNGGTLSSGVQERLLLKHLAEGVTTVRNMTGLPWHVAMRERVARGEVVGPRIYTAGPILYGNEAGGMTLTAATAASVVEAQRAAGYDFLKIYGGDSRPVFDSIISAAKRLGMPYAGHVPTEEGLSIEDALRVRYASIEHVTGYYEYLLEATGNRAAWEQAASDGGIVRMDELERQGEVALPTIAAATRRAGVWNVPTLVVMSSFGQSARRPRPPGRSIVKALYDAGAGLLLGTDGGENNIAVTEELQALVAAGLTPYDALATGTRNVAAFLGALDSTGTVAVGKRADLVLLADNPLADVRATAAPVGVVVGGRWLSCAELKRRMAALPPEKINWNSKHTPTECSQGGRKVRVSP